MTSAQSHPSLYDDRFTLRISQNAGDLIVWAPLPDDFGFTVGSEFSAPFDGQFLSGAIAKAAALAGVSSKLGVQTKKLYTSPEPTEISFDMHFEAYEDPVSDVFNPTVKLMAMSIGSSLKFEDALAKVKEIVEKGGGNGDLLNRLSGNNEGTDEGAASKAWDFLNFLQGPSTVTLRFGKVMKFQNAYISSVSPSFSNIMDKNGMPMSCTVSVTSILENDPIIDDDNFKNIFDRVDGIRE